MEALGLDRDFLVNACGCMERAVLTDEGKLDAFLVLKAILDKNMPKLLAVDVPILQNIVQDVFPDIAAPEISFTDALHDAITTEMEAKQMHMSHDLVQNVIHLNEAIQSRHGVMIVGPPMAGKTTSVRTLMDALNRLHGREWEEKYTLFLRRKGRRLGIKTKVVREKSQWPGMENQYIDEVVCAEPDPMLDAKLRLSGEELQLLLNTCTYKGIQNFTLNPKSLSMRELMGHFDETSREWTDGVMTHALRRSSLDASGRRVLVTFDGPIEPDWVENMNSVLDDNKRLNLVTGETIYLTAQMTVLLETSGLDDCSPATISRCAIVYVRRESLPSKAFFNAWLRSLPKILRDQTEKLDNYANYFLAEIFETWLKPDNMIYPMSQQWATKTFVMIMDALIADYRKPKFMDEKAIEKAAAKARGASKAPTLGKKGPGRRGSRDGLGPGDAKPEAPLGKVQELQLVEQVQRSRTRKVITAHPLRDGAAGESPTESGRPVEPSEIKDNQ